MSERVAIIPLVIGWKDTFLTLLVVDVGEAEVIVRFRLLGSMERGREVAAVFKLIALSLTVRAHGSLAENDFEEWL